MKITAEQIAEVCHEANRTYCRTLGDHSQPEWTVAPQWQKDSAINGVNFHINNPLATPHASHETWLKEKLETGWQYGPVKNLDKKEHPCCVPYNQLPPEQRYKDVLFQSIVHALSRPFELSAFELGAEIRRLGMIGR